MKTYENWTGTLSDYLDIGDIVDEELAFYFVEVMPPKTWTNDIIQCGEPYDHMGLRGRARHTTFEKENGQWIYKGPKMALNDLSII